MTNRTTAYHFTVRLSDGGQVHADYKDQVDALRAAVKEHNRETDGYPLYVKLQGRGHRYGVRRWNQSLPLSMATSADVYVYERR